MHQLPLFELPDRNCTRRCHHSAVTGDLRDRTRGRSRITLSHSFRNRKSSSYHLCRVRDRDVLKRPVQVPRVRVGLDVVIGQHPIARKPQPGLEELEVFAQVLSGSR